MVQRIRIRIRKIRGRNRNEVSNIKRGSKLSIGFGHVEKKVFIGWIWVVFM